MMPVETTGGLAVAGHMRHRQWRSGLFWAVLIATGLVFLAMQALTPDVSHGGRKLPIFDARVCGYDLEAARTYLNAISDTGKRTYLYSLQRLDLVFPLLLAVSIGWSILRLAPKEWGRIRHVLPFAAVPAMLADYLENLAVAGILKSASANLSPDLVRFASAATQVKYVFLAAAFIVLAALIAAAVRRRRRAGRS